MTVARHEGRIMAPKILQQFVKQYCWPHCDDGMRQLMRRRTVAILKLVDDHSVGVGGFIKACLLNPKNGTA
jgi:hypothetical protein